MDNRVVLASLYRSIPSNFLSSLFVGYRLASFFLSLVGYRLAPFFPCWITALCLFFVRRGLSFCSFFLWNIKEVIFPLSGDDDGYRYALHLLFALTNANSTDALIKITSSWGLGVAIYRIIAQFAHYPGLLFLFGIRRGTSIFDHYQ